MRRSSKSLDKLSILLYREYGLCIADEDFKIARGYWAHRHQDCLAWELTCQMAGRGLDPNYGSIMIDSWESISECAKKGIWLIEGSDGYGQYTAIAKSTHPEQPEADKFGHNGVITPDQFRAKHQKKDNP